MTDLERLWDDYPTSKAPVTAILAEAAGTNRPRRRLFVRPLLTAGVVTGLAGAFVAGTLVNGGSGGPGSTPGSDLPSRVAFQADLDPAENCDDLLATYVERASKLVGAWGWGGDRPYLRNGLSDDYGFMPLDGVAGDLEAAVAPQSAARSNGTPGTSRQTNSDTGTNVQEAGVDEPDTVKTDGEILTMVRDENLLTYDVTGTSTEKLSTIRLRGIKNAEIMLSGDTVVAIGVDDKAKPTRLGSLGTRVLTVSLADPADPNVVEDITYDAGVLSARQHGPAIRLVLESGLPDLDFVEPGNDRTRTEAEKENLEVVESSTIEDWLPTITVGDKGEQLLDCTDVAIPSDKLALATTSIVGFEVGSPDTVDAIGLAGRTGIAYESADHLYLATQHSRGGCFDWCEPGGPRGRGTIGGSAYLFDFALDGIAATHVASGEVEGAIRDRWSIDEADGVLRVAVGPTSETGNFNSIVTFERNGKELVEHGRLDNLGRNEDIKSVRWFDDLVIMVTFRQVDPLYAVDLTDTSTPKLLGKLKIPGFSSYLHPLGSWRMIGVGEGPMRDDAGRRGWGAQIGLFDVRDVTKVKRLDVLNYDRNTQPLAGADPRAFTWLPKERTVITVLEKYQGRRVGYVSVVKIDKGKLTQRLQQVEYGADVDLVRAVPMPDGRVVLVTGEAAQFFEL